LASFRTIHPAPAAPSRGIGFVCTSTRPPGNADLPIGIRAGIGFACTRSVTPIPQTPTYPAWPAIGFVLPRLLRGSIQHNSFSTKHLLFVHLRPNWLGSVSSTPGSHSRGEAGGTNKGVPNTPYVVASASRRCLRVSCMGGMPMPRGPVLSAPTVTQNGTRPLNWVRFARLVPPRAYRPVGNWVRLAQFSP